MREGTDPGSFRDPSGYVYWKDGELYRTVTQAYAEIFQAVTDAGLFSRLTEKGLLVEHQECKVDDELLGSAVTVIKPELIPFISYPYEWCFSQLKAAALLTLEIQKECMELGFSLKDASAYNVQFLGCRPIFIDTLSFEPLEEGKPWVAYKQFCQHFLAPLLLASKCSIEALQFSRIYLDGMPLSLASSLLPKSTRFSPMIAAHIHMHAKAQASVGIDDKRVSTIKISHSGLIGIVDNLASIIRKLDWSPTDTTWAEYYEHTNYSEDAMDAKKESVKRLLDQIEPAPTSVWDLGANNGEFASIATASGIRAVAWDIDPAAVEQNFRASRERGDALMLPLVQDLTNPSPGQGWAHEERSSLLSRGPASALFALALIHHLAIGNNVPLIKIAEYFSKLGEWLIIEFVPKEDSQVSRMLANREDVFTEYHTEGFLAAFSAYYDVVTSVPVEGTVRTLYLMRSKG